MNDLVYPKICVGEKVSVYRAFQGYCGIGLVKKRYAAAICPYYEILLLQGNYCGFEAPTTCYVSEDYLK